MTFRPGDLVAGGFRIGDQVELTDEAKAMHPRASHSGRVVGQSRDRKCITVIRTGRTARERWEPTLWRTAPSSGGDK